MKINTECRKVIEDIIEIYSNKIRHLEIGDGWSITEDEVKQVEKEIFDKYLHECEHDFENVTVQGMPDLLKCKKCGISIGE